MESGGEPGGPGAARVYELVRRELLTEFGADFFGAYIDQFGIRRERR